ncbi:ABC transporter ATP-binding protein [Micromonospora sp. WMMD882]|uniref:ABC transporter ATP-binding protein n=1 Tax=Micromonospora sp. WMMD882 TaxID=3015151 RepID=UPI00248D34F7|nr:ABC transporter ATP-binding protein [Micromonospora sp. WMMD882]WBB78457.1 ABC transporter ATP-binding protein [Micromonospora sp. WMMD882]
MSTGAATRPSADLPPGREALLTVRGLRVAFPTAAGGQMVAVDGVDLTLGRSEILGVVGESGSGKSLTALSLLRMVPPPGTTNGTVTFDGRDLLSLSGRELRTVRGARIAMVFQNPLAALNPVIRVGDQLVEAMLTHGRYTAAQARTRARELLELVGIPDAGARLRDFPHQFSGGMRQRIVIAMAVSNDPEVIIADEPTTALDVTIQAQVLDLLVKINRELGTAIVLISHNLGVVARACDRLLVMYGGRIVEQGTTADVFANPRHPYTRALLAAVPRLDSPPGGLTAIPGQPASISDRPAVGCRFAPRCAHADDRCRADEPPQAELPDRHLVACWKPEAATAAGAVDGAALTTAGTGTPLLELRDVSKEFRAGRLVGWRGRGTVSAVDSVSLTLGRAETLGLVGESGCGKSTLARLAMGIDQPTRGTVHFDGVDVTAPGARRAAGLHRKAQIVFQDPKASLNPWMTAGELVGEPLRVQRISSGRDRDELVGQALERVGLRSADASRYPGEFSGGQLQRIAIARALVLDPSLVVCDEPVSALDVSIQAQVVNLLSELQNTLGLSYLFVAHDLAVVRAVSHRVAVMYLGRIVELAPAEQLYAEPLHPYTAALISAAPVPDPVVERTRKYVTLPGDLPSPLRPPPGCRFHTRCPIGPTARPGRDICRTASPPLRQQAPGRFAACHFAGELHRIGVDPAPSTSTEVGG